MSIKLLIPDMPLADELLPYLQQIDANRHYTNYGPLNSELERRLLEYFKLKQPEVSIEWSLTTVANATLGLEMTFASLNLPKDANVLIPALTFPATATAAVRQGLIPVFSGVHSDSWLLTPEIAHQAVSDNPNIQLIVPVATFGVPVDVREWDQFVEETGIPVVIDAAGAFSNQLAGQKVHTVFSLHATKALGGGEGGFIISPDGDVIKKIRILSNFGIEPECEGKIFDVGTNAKLSEYHAAIALTSLDRWEVRRVHRMHLLDLWLQKLAPFIESGRIELQKDMEKYSHSLLPLRFRNIDDIPTLMNFFADRKIQTRRWYHPLLPLHPAFAAYATAGDIFSVRKLSSELLGLPFHLDLSTEDIDYIVATISDYQERDVISVDSEGMVA